MIQTIDVYALPSHVEPNQLAGTTVVVIDVIRASTTIISALAADAKEVHPFLEIDDARAAAEILDSQQGRQSYLLGGERNAVVIDGFDLGNSPSDYTKERVADRIVLFTTTNGTRAMMRCRSARQVFIGAFVNAEAITQRLVDEERIVLLCAGTEGEESGDDLLLAGLLVERLQRRTGECFQLNDRAAQTRTEWQAVAESDVSTEWLAECLAETRGGKNVVRAGLASDLLDVAAIDRFSIVPELDVESVRIR